MQKPCAVFGIGPLTFVVRLVAAAGQLSAVAQLHTEAELHGLYGSNVKEGHVPAEDRSCLAVCDLDEMNVFPDTLAVPTGEQKLGRRAQDVDDLGVRIDVDLALRRTRRPLVGKLPEQPKDAGDMIRVPVSDKDIPYLIGPDACALQLAQKAVAASAVHKEMLSVLTEDKAGVIAPTHGGMACT